MSLQSLKLRVSSALAGHPTLRTLAIRTYTLPNAIVAPLRDTEAGLLAELAAEKQVFFLQIGAHDGKTDDHIHSFVRKYGWRGILVEPVKPLFDRLVENYRGAEGLIFENKAVAADNGSHTLFRVRDDADLPDWCSQLSSLRRDVVLRKSYLAPKFERYLIEEQVNCVSFANLMACHGVTRLDVILIDTEGYDFEILRQVDFDRYRPRLVIYEQKHLSPAEKKQALRLLESHGYSVKRIGVGWNNAAVRGA